MGAAQGLAARGRCLRGGGGGLNIVFWGRNPSKKSSSEQVFLNNLCWVPDSKVRLEHFEKVRVNAVCVFVAFLDLGWRFVPLKSCDACVILLSVLSDQFVFAPTV